MQRSVDIIVISEHGSEKATRSYTAEGKTLDELMASAHAQLDRAIADVESATHHKAGDSVSVGEPFAGISLEEQRRLRRDQEILEGIARDRATRSVARGGRGKMPDGNTGAP